MYGKAGVLLRVLVIVAAVGIAAGCSTELRQLQGANQDLVKQRDALQRQIADLQGQLAASQADKAAAEAQLGAARADIDYWKGQAGAYSAAADEYKKYAGRNAQSILEQIALEMGGTVLPNGGLRLPGDILFESGKADLKPAAKAAFQKAAEVLQSEKAKGLYLRIDGHTDGQPIKRSHWKDNMELSQARSRAVWLALKTGGVGPERMFTAGFGEFKPADSNATAKGRQVNRRVEIWVVAPPTAPESAGEAPAPTEEAPAAVETPAAPSEAAPAAGD